MDINTITPAPHNLRLGQKIAERFLEMPEAQGLTLDANDLSVIFARELEFVDQKLQEQKFAPLKSELLIPHQPRGGAGVRKVTWRKVTELGQAKIAANGITEIPRVDVVGQEFERKVYPLVAAWAVTIFELQEIASNPTIRLDDARKRACQNAIRRLKDTIAFIGNTALGWTGLVNDANIPVVTPITGDWLNPATTPAQILADVNKLCWAPYIATKENFSPDTLLIPTSVGQRFDEPIGDNADKTIRAYILKNSTFIKNIETTQHLETASAGSGIRAMVYAKHPDVLVFGNNESYAEEAPQPKGLEIETPAHGKVSGTQIFQPLACGYMDID